MDNINTSKHIGVTEVGAGPKNDRKTLFKVQVCLRGHIFSLGRFDDLDAALHIYDNAVMHVHKAGYTARPPKVNFPDDWRDPGVENPPYAETNTLLDKVQQVCIPLSPSDIRKSGRPPKGSFTSTSQMLDSVDQVLMTVKELVRIVENHRTSLLACSIDSDFRIKHARWYRELIPGDDGYGLVFEDYHKLMMTHRQEAAKAPKAQDEDGAGKLNWTEKAPVTSTPQPVTSNPQPVTSDEQSDAKPSLLCPLCPPRTTQDAVKAAYGA